MQRVLISLAVAAFALCASPAALAQQADPTAGVTAGPVASPELVAQIRARDAELFSIAFDTCDWERLRDLVAREFEFVHDKAGVTARTPEEFVENFRQDCEGRATGQNVRASRELVEGSLQVYAVQDNGAIEIGEHRFYGLADGHPPHLRETGRFFMYWTLEDGVWKLAQVYSYDHRPAE